MRIILDTDKKTITVPWNYTAKLEEMNKMIAEVTDDPEKKKTFLGYIKECWDYAMANSDTHVKTGQKPKSYNKSNSDNVAALSTLAAQNPQGQANPTDKK